MEILYMSEFFNHRDRLETRIHEFRIVEETPKYFIVCNQYDFEILVSKENIDKPGRCYHSTRKEAIASLREMAFLQIKGAKEAINRYQEAAFDLEQEMKKY